MHQCQFYNKVRVNCCRMTVSLIVISSVTGVMTQWIKQLFKVLMFVPNITHTHTHRLTAFFRDYPGEPVPER